MMRACTPADLPDILAVVNEGATAYQGAVPAACLGDPYMGEAELRRELADGVAFWGWEEEGRLVGVMGSQHIGEATLIRHAYVRPAFQGRGIGDRLLAHLKAQTTRPILIGTWRAATWAIQFYERRGFQLVPRDEAPRLLQRFWSVSSLQADHSVVLHERGRSDLVPYYELVELFADGTESPVLDRGADLRNAFTRIGVEGARAGRTHLIYRVLGPHRGVFESYGPEEPDPEEPAS